MKRGRPKTGMIRINVYLTNSQWPATKKIAEALGLTASELLRRWVDEKLDALKKK